MPKLLTEVGHQRVQHPLQLLHHLGQHLAGHPLISQGLSAGVLARVQPPLAELQIPITDLIPSKFIEAFGCFTKAIAAVTACRLAVDAGQAGEDPTIRQLQRSRIRLAKAVWSFSAQIHQGKAGGIPELVGEVAGCFNGAGGVALAVVIQANVLSGTCHLTDQSKAQGISAITIDQQQRVDAIAR